MALRCSNSLLVALALLALPAVANAQAYQCRAPQVRAVLQITPDGPRRDLPVTGYTLALSWSPEFCKPRKASRADAVQRSGSNGSCMVKRPAAYLKVTRILWDSLRIPDYDRISREEPLTAGRIRAAFADANPSIPAHALRREG